MVFIGSRGCVGLFIMKWTQHYRSAEVNASRFRPFVSSSAIKVELYMLMCPVLVARDDGPGALGRRRRENLMGQSPLVARPVALSKKIFITPLIFCLPLPLCLHCSDDAHRRFLFSHPATQSKWIKKDHSGSRRKNLLWETGGPPFLL